MPGVRPAAPPWTLHMEVNAGSATAIWKTYQCNKILQKEHNHPKNNNSGRVFLLQNTGFHFPQSLTTQNNIPNTFLIVLMSHWGTFLKDLYINAQWYHATVLFVPYLVKLIPFCACYSDRKAILRLYSLPFNMIRFPVTSYIVTIILPHIQEICCDWCSTKLIRHFFLYFLLVLVFHGSMLKGDSLL